MDLYVSLFPVTVTKYLRIINLYESEIDFGSGFRDFSPWSLGPTFWGSMATQYTMEGTNGRGSTKQPGSKERQEGSGVPITTKGHGL